MRPSRLKPSRLQPSVALLADVVIGIDRRRHGRGGDAVLGVSVLSLIGYLKLKKKTRNRRPWY